MALEPVQTPLVWWILKILHLHHWNWTKLLGYSEDSLKDCWGWLYSGYQLESLSMTFFDKQTNGSTFFVDLYCLAGSVYKILVLLNS